MVCDELCHPERGLEPVEDGVAVPHHAGGGLCRAEPEQRRASRSASAWLSFSTIPSWIARPIANGISAWATIQSTPNSTPRKRVPRWLPADPDEQAGRRARVGVTGVGDRQLNGPKECHAKAREASRAFDPSEG